MLWNRFGVRLPLPPSAGEAVAATAEEKYNEDDDDQCCGVHGATHYYNGAAPSIRARLA
jgi:hypothetical protein